mgnify:CR=1 FL=1
MLEYFIFKIYLLWIKHSPSSHILVLSSNISLNIISSTDLFFSFNNLFSFISKKGKVIKFSFFSFLNLHNPSHLLIFSFVTQNNLFLLNILNIDIIGIKYFNSLFIETSLIIFLFF